MNKWSILCAAFAFTACGGEVAKDKIELAGDDDGKSFDVAMAAVSGGNWSELRVVETAHPYANTFTRRWEVTGAADALEMRVVMSRFELENGYDFITVSDGAGGQRSRHTGDKTGTEVVLTGNRVVLDFSTDASVTRWGARVTVLERRPCACPAIYNPVCGADGNTYSNACAASCEGVAVSRSGACASTWVGAPRLIESAHPYADNARQSWTLREPGATRIRAHLSRVDVERGYDFVTVLDGADRVVASYTGVAEDVLTPTVQGDTLKIRFETDTSVTGFGFVLDRSEVQGGCGSDADCAPGDACTQIQCLREPCFPICQPRPSGYQAVALASLDQNPTVFEGVRVAVEAEPRAGVAGCTKVACAPSNPCCNRCSASLIIGNDIRLEDGTGTRALGCSGNECNYASQCTPFPGTDAGLYELRGTFHVDAMGAKRLVVDSLRAAACAPTGCSRQVCANNTVVTTCEARPEYACYAGATCESQADGLCAWTPTSDLAMCLAGPPMRLELPSTSVPLTIPDNDSRGVAAIVVVPAQTRAANVAVSARVSHTYRGDLRVVLVSPAGVETVLHDRTGGSYDNLVLEGQAVGRLEAGALRGTWRLRVSDLARLDTGRVDSFSLILN